jgi:hypothetical protein
MTDPNEKTAEVFEVIGEVAKVIAQRTGPLGIGALGVSVIADAVAGVIRSRGASVDEILAAIKEPRELSLKILSWDELPSKEPKE